MKKRNTACIDRHKEESGYILFISSKKLYNSITNEKEMN